MITQASLEVMIDIMSLSAKIVSDNMLIIKRVNKAQDVTTIKIVSCISVRPFQYEE